MTTERHDSRARKTVQARRLTDPLGALGQRRQGDRIEHEARLRRGMFAGSLAVFAASFAIVTATGVPGHDPVVDPLPPMGTVEGAAIQGNPGPALFTTADGGALAVPDREEFFRSLLGEAGGDDSDDSEDEDGYAVAALANPEVDASESALPAFQQQAGQAQPQARQETQPRQRRQANARTRSS